MNVGIRKAEGGYEGEAYGRRGDYFLEGSLGFAG
jgi:hypothetical protein